MKGAGILATMTIVRESELGRVTFEIMNAERLEENLDNVRRHFINKMKMQSDEQMKVFEEYAVRKHTELAKRAKKNII